MTIGIVGFGELSYLPFLSKYTEVFDAEGAVYDVLYWNREGLREEAGFASRRLESYAKRSPVRRSVPGKLVDFLGYRRHVEGWIRRHGYDRLVVLTTMPAVLLAGTLARRYARRYVFDVRDYAYEHVPFFLAAERKVVRHAALCVASSPGFRSWLPAADWKISHNVSGRALREWLARDHAAPREVLRRPVRVLRFVGRTRSPEEMRAVIDQLGGRSDYEVHYHGDDVLAWDAAAYARTRGAGNVHFHGRYRPEERWSFYADADVVLSGYDRRLPGQATLLNNKLYDAAMALRPLLVTRGTYLAETVERYGLGLAMDAQRESIAEALDGYAAAFDPTAFAAGCRRFLEDVRRDDDVFVSAVRGFARGD